MVKVCSNLLKQSPCVFWCVVSLEKGSCALFLFRGTNMISENNQHICCFIGHRKINDTPQIRKYINELLTHLIQNGTTDFIFGDHSEFNSLCYEIVTELKKEYPHIRRIHFRKDYEEANDYTMEILLKGFEDSICPRGISNAGIASYAERNQAMIRESDICIFYYDENYLPKRRKMSKHSLTDYQPKSGTAVAYEYAVSKNKKIINVYSNK